MSDVNQEIGTTLHFVSDELIRHVKPKKEKYFCSVNVKWGLLSFPKSTITDLAYGNKFFHLYYDGEHKAIAWRVKGKADLSVVKKRNGWKIVKPQKNGTWQVSVAHILKQFNNLEQSYRDLEIKKYQEKSILDDEPYYFVRIRKSHGSGKE